MSKNMRKGFLILSLVVLLAVAPLAYSHPGGLDSKGCHTCRTNCEKYGIPDGYYHRNDPLSACTEEDTSNVTSSPTTTPPPVPELFSSKKPRIIILANSIDYELASDFFGFLKNKGMETVKASAEDFEQYKSEKFIVILGGPDAYDGIGDIVQEILSEDEQNAIREKGKRKKYTKSNPWGVKSGQRVTILAGSDRSQTKKSHEENKDSVSSEANETSDPTDTPPSTTPAPTTTTPPTTTTTPTTPPPISDYDGDGLIGDADLCPGEKEYINNLLDSDGCPDANVTMTSGSGDVVKAMTNGFYSWVYGFSTDVNIRVRDFDNSTVRFIIYEGGAVIEQKIMNSSSNPQLKEGIDLELYLDDSYGRIVVYLEEINVQENYVRVSIFRCYDGNPFC